MLTSADSSGDGAAWGAKQYKTLLFTQMNAFSRIPVSYVPPFRWVTHCVKVSK